MAKPMSKKGKGGGGGGKPVGSGGGITKLGGPFKGGS
jgi:hypothetical protein